MYHFPLSGCRKGATWKGLEAQYGLATPVTQREGEGQTCISCISFLETATIRHLAYGLRVACLTGKQTII